MALSIDQVETDVHQWESTFPGSFPLNVDVEPSANFPDPSVLVYGQYEYANQQVVLFADAFDSYSDVATTLNHEILGHYLMDWLPNPVEYYLKTQILLDALTPGSTLFPEFVEVANSYGPATLLDPDALSDEIWAHFVEDSSHWVNQDGYFARVEQGIIKSWEDSDNYRNGTRPAHTRVSYGDADLQADNLPPIYQFNPLALPITLVGNLYDGVSGLLGGTAGGFPIVGGGLVPVPGDSPNQSVATGDQAPSIGDMPYIYQLSPLTLPLDLAGAVSDGISGLLDGLLGGNDGALAHDASRNPDGSASGSLIDPLYSVAGPDGAPLDPADAGLLTALTDPGSADNTQPGFFETSSTENPPFIYQFNPIEPLLDAVQAHLLPPTLITGFVKFAENGLLDLIQDGISVFKAATGEDTPAPFNSGGYGSEFLSGGQPQPQQLAPAA